MASRKEELIKKLRLMDLIGLPSLDRVSEKGLLARALKVLSDKQLTLHEEIAETRNDNAAERAIGLTTPGKLQDLDDLDDKLRKASEHLGISHAFFEEAKCSVRGCYSTALELFEKSYSSYCDAWSTMFSDGNLIVVVSPVETTEEEVDVEDALPLTPTPARVEAEEEEKSALATMENSDLRELKELLQRQTVACEEGFTSLKDTLEPRITALEQSQVNPGIVEVLNDLSPEDVREALEYSLKNSRRFNNFRKERTEPGRIARLATHIRDRKSPEHK